ncbi:pre-rRNA-processing protein TSR2 homolog [Tenebrio molitor]|jgi:pre-rRNA-processing protein TSR2|uniref:pre-rRNA-processing protein TSR2 homolog n=1 Tax=Tenebrio molitor TaxID=7067 RepID=UPI001C3B7629|nr:unnamed protein product [Tenebrio molitor]
MENSFKRVIEHIFDNWTGLKLAVDYGSAGSNSKEVATGFMNYMIEYCLNESNVDVDSIQEALDDVMDQEFDTICEDGSTKEIAILLYKFLELIKQGNTVAFDEEYQKLSVSGACTNKNEIAVKENLNNDICEHSEIEENCTPMDQDSEWIEVKSRKRR